MNETRRLAGKLIGAKTSEIALLGSGISNFLSNLRMPLVVVNQLFQGQGKNAAESTGRFLINSTVGVLGLIDVADKLFKSIKGTISKIVEVGAGDCHFAKVIMELNPDLDYFAYDPSYKTSEVQSKLFKYNEYYQLKDIKPSLVVVRHTLEHIMDVNKFIESVTNELPINVFIETPCSSFVLRNNFHYFSYEHCSYFDQKSLILHGFGMDPGTFLRMPCDVGSHASAPQIDF